MGRKRILRPEATTSIGAYHLESDLLEDFCRKGETKPDALRRLFEEFFPANMIKDKKRQLIKKIERQDFLNGNQGDQSMIDDLSKHFKQYIDHDWMRKELREMIIQARGSEKRPLANREADDSIERALNRGDIELLENGNYKILRKWF